MLYYYWSRKGIRPSIIQSMSAGERHLIRAFFEMELEERHKAAKTGNVFVTMSAL
ncbi:MULTISPECIES: hypothetical protein [Paenibacillus]|uniref:Transposase n=1 Tax=Paenibacillus arenosi TaxID=2774142 RepID=A0ABR9B358_9BACL|nr:MULTISPECIES: hypothetical protein [Paenibacillus]MBD8500742.1 hypothetical protein [Paenibacillus arenosi]